MAKKLGSIETKLLRDGKKDEERQKPYPRAPKLLSGSPASPHCRSFAYQIGWVTRAPLRPTARPFFKSHGRPGPSSLGISNKLLPLRIRSGLHPDLVWTRKFHGRGSPLASDDREPSLACWSVGCEVSLAVRKATSSHWLS